MPPLHLAVCSLHCDWPLFPAVAAYIKDDPPLPFVYLVALTLFDRDQGLLFDGLFVACHLSL